ncbi:hypothetical protein [Streptomyces sp. Z26]|uniref:hypothetical protein n=1 Tax=Streptomyces sp. Z26 TaxID=2500177 RepID=UPI000FCAE063|nr:hypothetical protein [Streptomyces sp. Z26]
MAGTRAEAAGDGRGSAVRGRSLEALGFTDVPALRPLTYPGRPVDGPSLLDGDDLLELRPTGGPLGEWPVQLPGAPRRTTVDGLLARRGLDPVAARFPVLAVGSNAAPGQVRHKLARLGRSHALPMVPVRVRGLAVGLSAHVSPAGYVAAAPYVVPGATSALVLTWLDAAQLAAVDRTELPNYARAFLPGDGDGDGESDDGGEPEDTGDADATGDVPFAVTLPGGRRLPGAYVYHSARGVLARPAPDRTALRCGPQPAVLAGLLAGSARLRELFGPTPETWVTRAAADPALRALGTAAFVTEGLLRREEGFAPYAAGPDTRPLG